MNKERLKHIWQTPIYLPYIHNDLTDEMVKNAEQKIGHKLPEEYLNLLKAQNGGYIRYELEDKEHSKIYGIGDHYPSVTINQLEEDTEAEPSFEIKGLTPFDDGEHTYLCFDYRKNGAEPTIAYIDVECDEEETIANNFKEYLSLLTPATRHKFVIQTEIGIEKTIKELGDILQIKFEEKADDYFLYGYPMYYAQYSQKYNIFIHPNKSPKYFARERERGYERLKELGDQSVLMYPEIRQDFPLMSCYNNEAAEEIIEKLAKRGVTVQALKVFFN